MKNFRQRTLEDLEGDRWAVPDFPSRLVQEIRRLGAVPLELFTVEDLRLLILQEQGLSYVLPLAFEHLSQNPFAEGDLYVGDLLAAVLHVNAVFWQSHPDLHGELRRILRAAVDRLGELEPLDSEALEPKILEAVQTHGVALDR